MKLNQHDIKNYLEGKTDQLRSEQIREWLIDPKNETQVRQLLGEIWTNSQIKLSGSKPDFDQLLSRVHYRIHAQPGSSFAAPSKTRKIGRIYQMFARAAAILILPLLLFTAYLYFSSPTGWVAQGELVMREIYTKPGTRTSLTLADGTKVWLNDGTIFKYPEQFTASNRTVFVDGEAYFEVKSDLQHPFVVENPLMKTVVTGTQFNLHAYSADQFFETTLLEGKIHLEGQAGHIELDPGQQVQFDATTNVIEKKEVKSTNAAAWIDGKLMIQNERLDLAVKKLSRWYNVEMVITEPQLKELELTCTLENEKLDQCMNLIAQALPIRYQLTEEKIQGQIRQKIQLMRK
ncbi:FecR family protein [Gaoshiqia sediminis]|uniref:FecR domain-containing protein n=1 Tax=Gaoshiqia sediminis TaxID=2986998 RepID=A0AA41Y3Q8_9BACT|nr:FecR domain-containing protein [Gaoshiqia sediminis]MCW0481314.1 FecR domain-containing protein [Gaoshiqia sediminis]